MKSSRSSRARGMSFSSILSSWLGQQFARRRKSTEALRRPSARLAGADRLLVEALEDRLAPGDAFGLLWLLPSSPAAAVTDAATPAVARDDLAGPEIVGDYTASPTQASQASTDFGTSAELPALSGTSVQDSAPQQPTAPASPVGQAESSATVQQDDLSDPVTFGWLPEGLSTDAPLRAIAASAAAVPATGIAAPATGDSPPSAGQMPTSVATGPIAANSPSSQQVNPLGSLAAAASAVGQRVGQTPGVIAQSPAQGVTLPSTPSVSVVAPASASAHNPVLFNLDGGGNSPADGKYSPVSGAYSPAQLQTAYGVNQLGTSNQGQNETIAIVDELNDSSIIADANAYSSQYSLPQFNATGGPTMTVVEDSDLGKVGSAAGTGVGYETSLDVEMVHAMAPQANILLVEVPASGTVANEFAQLLEGVQYAAKQSGVVAVSLSYGYAESEIGNSSVVSLNKTYLASGAASNVVVTVSTGDDSTPLFPATSPNVVAVGGTSLYLSSGAYGHETAWGGVADDGAGGGGPSTNFAAPTFQSDNGVTLSTKRTVPDISMEADPATGVSVYDSFDAGRGDPWAAFGGTSVAAPLTAGVIGLAQQLRIANGKSILNSVQLDTAIYEAYDSTSASTYFHDITQGKNSDVNSRGQTVVTGYSATKGYDEATGIGSPIANALVPYLSNF